MIKGLPLLLLAFAALVPAQAQNLQVEVTANGAVSTLQTGGSASLTSTGVGQPVLATVAVRYTGAGAATLNGLAFGGTNTMTIVNPPSFPITIFPNGTTTFTVQYLPTSGAAATGQFSIAYTESTPFIFTFNLVGTAPDIVFSSYLVPNGVPSGLNAGDRISFPATNVGGASTIAINVLNRGSAPGILQSVSLTGADFQVTDSPAPITVPAGDQVSFGVAFRPRAAGTSTGVLSVGFNNVTAVFLLAGAGSTADLSVLYRFADNNVRSLTDGAIITFPPADINGTVTATVDIANQGTGVGIIAGISVTGNAFQASGLPPFPLTIGAGQSLRFSIVFNPKQAGSQLGALQIDLNGRTISAALSGSTIASNLVLSYALADGNSHVFTDGTIISLPAVDVGASTTTSITVFNPGPGSGTVTGVSISGTGFQITGVPVLPATLTSNQSLRFAVVLTPTQTGSQTGTVRIDLNGTSVTATLSATTSTPTFALSYALADGIVRPLQEGTNITFPAIDVNTTSTANITVFNQGPGVGTITGISLAGTGFVLSGAPQLPATVPTGQSVRFGIVFTTAKTGSFTGSFRIDLTGRSISGSLSASTAPAGFNLSYIDPDTTNVLPLPDTSTLPFPSTLVGSTATITVVAANTGTGTGTVNSITLGAGPASPFQVVSLPPLPITVPPAQQFRFGIRFTPKQQDQATDTLLVDFDGKLTSISLQARGTAPQFSYGWATGTSTSAIAPGSTTAVPDIPVGQTSSVVVSVFNSGNGDGQVPAIGVSGQGFTLSQLPTVPFTLKPNTSQTFTLNFTPTQPGTVTGKLTIGNDNFTITGTGIGSRLIFTYTSADTAIPVTDSGVVIFAPVAVGNNASLNFAIQNTGTVAATITSIALSSPSSIFSLSQLPAMPFNLAPGATVTFPISFIPNNTGTLTATLRVNNTTFTLSGTGTQPVSLPAYQFQGVSGNQAPAQQPSIGLTLSSSYPLPLQGTLKLAFSSSVFTDDPSIQFASGGRLVNFTIPANTTRALFIGNAPTIALQTGTTAGTIVVTPTFATSGGFDLTPPTPDALTLTVQRAAPQLLSASITSQTLTSFVLVLNGYSTTRTIRQLDIQVTPKTGQNFSSTHLTIDVTSASSAWFQSTTAQTFGGSFQLAVPFNLSNGNSTDDLVRMLQSLSVTATNDVGVSNAISLNIQ